MPLWPRSSVSETLSTCSRISRTLVLMTSSHLRIFLEWRRLDKWKWKHVISNKGNQSISRMTLPWIISTILFTWKKRVYCCFFLWNCSRGARCLCLFIYFQMLSLEKVWSIYFLMFLPYFKMGCKIWRHLLWARYKSGTIFTFCLVVSYQRYFQEPQKWIKGEVLAMSKFKSNSKLATLQTT